MGSALRDIARRTVVSVGLVLMLASVSSAEGISGVVKDESGGVLPGATVTISNVGTGVGRTVAAGTGGRYDATGLPPGTYAITASLPGFTTAVRRGVTLTVGRDIVVDMMLAVGEVTDEVVVTAEAPLVETTSAAVSGLVDERAIRDLPLVSRSWDQLITLQAGTVVYRPVVQGGSQGFAERFTVSGQRFTSNSFYQDGVELGGAQRLTGLPGSAAGVNLGVEGIREFRVLTSSYSPEYGKKSGGAILTVTKSGTNELRGSVFEFHRNSKFDAPNFFSVSRKDPFRRNNFGGTLGGPLARSRTFFFGNYEALRERLATPFAAIVPNARAREGYLPNRSGQLEFVGVAPAVKPFLALWPMPNDRDYGDGTAAYKHASTRITREDYVLGRMDHNFSEKDSLFASYTFSDAQLKSPLENPFFQELTNTREQRLAVDYKRIMTSQMLNTLLFGFHRSHHDTANRALIDLAPLGLPEVNPGRGMVNLNVTGLAFGGPGTYGGTFGTRNSFQVNDQLSYVRNRHSFEFGGQFQRIQFNEDPEERKNGEWAFDGLLQLLRLQPRLFTGVFPPGSTGVLGIGLPMDINPGKQWRNTYGAVYARDKFHVSSNLTLDLGLRYEVLSAPIEADGRASNMLVKTEIPGIARIMDTVPVVGKKIWDTRWGAGLAPRIGVAWDPFGNGKTSVLAGYGIFYDQIETEFRFWMHINPPFAPRPVTSRPDAFPVPWDKVAVKDLGIAGRSIDPDIQVPRVQHFNVALDQQVGNAGMFRVAYVGARGSNQIYDVETNLAMPQRVNGQLYWPAGAGLVQPALQGWDLLMSGAHSKYDALEAEFQTRFSNAGAFRRLRSKAAYTFSKSIDNVSTLQGTAGQHTSSKLLDPFDLERDRGLSAFHAGHLFSANFTYDLVGLPVSGVAGALVNNWQVSGIWRVASGIAINVQNGIRSSRNRQNSSSERPDLIPGGNNNPVLGGYERYFDPTQFRVPVAGYLGNLGRNTLIGPVVSTFDMSIARRFPITAVSERFNLQFRAEIFNVFNRVNLGVPDRLVFDSRGGVRGAAGRIINTSTAARQMQFGLKLEF